MADEPETPEIDELVLDTPVELEAPDANLDNEEEEIPTFGDTPEEARDTDNSTLRHMRDRLKEANKRIAELERSVPASIPVEIGKKPDLYDDCEGDPERFEAELDAWKARKADAERHQNAAQEAAQQQQKQLETRLAKLAEQKQALGRPDADEAMDTVVTALGEAKFAGIAGLLDDETDAAKFFYALSQSPTVLQELASQTDGIKLLKRVTKLEGQLQMTRRRAVIDPDTPERGSGKLSPESSDKTLEKLEKEAERTKDRSKVIAYKRKLREG